MAEHFEPTQEQREQGAMPTRDEIYNVMKEVYDPEIGMNVVDLGLIYGVEIEDRTVVISMTLTTPACPLGPMLESQAYAVVTSQFPAVENVRINWVWDPPWDPRTMASEEAKLELGIW